MTGIVYLFTIILFALGMWLGDCAVERWKDYRFNKRYPR